MILMCNNGLSTIQDFKTILTLYPIIVLQSKISSARILDNTTHGCPNIMLGTLRNKRSIVQYQILFAQTSNCSFLPLKELLQSFFGNLIIQNG